MKFVRIFRKMTAVLAMLALLGGCVLRDATEFAEESPVAKMETEEFSPPLTTLEAPAEPIPAPDAVPEPNIVPEPDVVPQPEMIPEPEPVAEPEPEPEPVPETPEEVRERRIAEELAQIVTMVDSTTFDLYLNNMRTFMTDGLKEADLVLFNRCDENTPKRSYRRGTLALNNTVRIYFDNIDGTTDDGITEEDLPYDMSANPVVITDDLFGIWYIDTMEHPERYDGKVLKLKGQVAYGKNMPNKCYVLSRQAMTCCADDIAGIGYVCMTDKPIPAEGEFVEVVVKAEKAYSPIHAHEALILIEQSREKAEKPEEEIVTFN